MNQPFQLTPETSLRVLRTVHISFLVASVLIIYVGETAAPRDSAAIKSSVFYALAIAAGLAALFGWTFQRKMSAAAEQQAISGMPIELAALQRRQVGYMIAFACSLSVTLYGFVLLFLGATRTQIVPLYVVGIVLLLYFTPRRLQ
jgi:hypothetical protein